MARNKRGPTPPIRLPDFMKSAERTSKSSALAPHNWMMALGTTILLGGSYLKLPTWVVASFGGGTIVLTVISFVWTNRHFALTDPDRLRSEKYNLDKMALQKQIVGDDRKGLHEATDLDGVDVNDAIDVGTDAVIEKPKGKP